MDTAPSVTGKVLSTIYKEHCGRKAAFTDTPPSRPSPLLTAAIRKPSVPHLHVQEQFFKHQAPGPAGASSLNRWAITVLTTHALIISYLLVYDHYFDFLSFLSSVYCPSLCADFHGFYYLFLLTVNPARTLVHLEIQCWWPALLSQHHGRVAQHPGSIPVTVCEEFAPSPRFVPHSKPQWVGKLICARKRIRLELNWELLGGATQAAVKGVLHAVFQ